MNVQAIDSLIRWEAAVNKLHVLASERPESALQFLEALNDLLARGGGMHDLRAADGYRKRDSDV